MVGVVSVLPVVERHAILDPHEPCTFGPSMSKVFVHLSTKDLSDFIQRDVALKTSVDFVLDLLPVSVLEGLSDC